MTVFIPLAWDGPTLVAEGWNTFMMELSSGLLYSTFKFLKLSRNQYRTIDDPLLVSRAATFWILSAEVFTDPDYKDWNFADGNAMDIPLEDFPLYQYIDYVRVWREVETPGN